MPEPGLMAMVDGRFVEIATLYKPAIGASAGRCARAKRIAGREDDRCGGALHRRISVR
jgi:hypothetical protein